MKLTEEVKSAIRHIVMDEYDHQGIVRDVDIIFTYDHAGDDCVAVQLIIDPNIPPKKVIEVLYFLPAPISKYLHKNNIDLYPLIEFKEHKA